MEALSHQLSRTRDLTVDPNGREIGMVIYGKNYGVVIFLLFLTQLTWGSDGLRPVHSFGLILGMRAKKGNVNPA